ncbi:hypothetical protein D3C76_1269520 [compost metagenome]
MREQIEALKDKAHMLAQAAYQPLLLPEGLSGIDGDIPDANGPPFWLLQQINAAQ